METKMAGNVGIPARPLTDGVVSLRAIAESDIPLLYDWRNDENNRPLFRDDRAFAFAAHSRFVESFLAANGGDYWWMVEDGGIPVGTISLYGFDAERRACEFGRFIIARERRGAGYGRRALVLVMAFARSIGVERMRCEVLGSNEPALRLYESLGFAAKGASNAGTREFILMEAAI